MLATVALRTSIGSRRRSVPFSSSRSRHRGTLGARSACDEATGRWPPPVHHNTPSPRRSGRTAKLLQKVSEPLRDAPDIFLRRSARALTRLAQVREPGSAGCERDAERLGQAAIRDRARAGNAERPGPIFPESNASLRPSPKLGSSVRSSLNPALTLQSSRPMSRAVKARSVASSLPWLCRTTRNLARRSTSRRICPT